MPPRGLLLPTLFAVVCVGSDVSVCGHPRLKNGIFRRMKKCSVRAIIQKKWMQRPRIGPESMVTEEGDKKSQAK